ncbi:MAG: DUF4340 domain-containing protein [Anaerolineae bacterium]|nr:MAG: DUF4340 domain-containing protein [Anaerolineae bacterium]
MVKKETWYVVGAFAVLLLVALVVQRQQAAEAAEVVPTPRPVVLLLDVTQIAGLEIEGPDGARAALSLGADGQWVMDEPPATAAEVDQFTVQSAISGLGTLYEQSALDPISDLASVGLATPEYVIRILLLDGSNQELEVGGKTFNGGAYYVRVPGNDPQLVNLFTLDAVLDLLRTPPLIPATGGEP